MNRYTIALAFACCITMQVGAQAPRSVAHSDTAELRQTLDAIAAAHHGVLGYSIINLDTGERLSLRGDDIFNSFVGFR